MHRIALLAVAVAAAVIPVSATPAPSKTVTVSITRAGFVPRDVTIAVGDAVMWVNSDTQNHQVVSQQAGFASPVLRPTETFSFTFTRAGKFSYRDPLSRNARGSVTVTGPAASVTIAARPQTVVYGSPTTLSGTVSNQQAGERVTLLAQSCGQSSFATATTVTTTTGGAWSAAHKPLRKTAYRARWKNANSPNASVGVRPRLRLRRLAPRRYSVRALAAQSFAGKVAVFQRYNATTRRWVRVRFVVLRAVAGGTSPTVVSGATFRSSVPAGRRVRVVLGATQTAPCYAVGRSNVIRS